MIEYYVEITDTFGREVNYSWVLRYAVTAKNETLAIGKAARASGYRFRKEGDIGDCVRYKARGACVVAFISVFDPDALPENIKTI